MKDDTMKVCDSGCRESTVVELLEHKRNEIIRELTRVTKAIEDLKFKDVSNDTLRVLVSLKS